ncbi:hypothetical protein Ciccas_004455 [Cichlidogyrus casuarinus]|uniref:Uncharacterized protein n=1 Tax=Cichlidogyrus casuarinus TaxID=1844966 RepID=A0ABD2QBI3_9PLAT
MCAKDSESFVVENIMLSLVGFAQKNWDLYEEENEFNCVRIVQQILSKLASHEKTCLECFSLKGVLPRIFEPFEALIDTKGKFNLKLIVLMLQVLKAMAEHETGQKLIRETGVSKPRG